MNQKGFTLVELIIYTAIVGLVVVSLVRFSLSIVQSRNTGYGAQEVQANNRVMLEEISRTIRAATGINTSTSAFDIAAGVLSLSTDTTSTNPTIIGLNTATGAVELKEGTSASTTLSSNVVAVTSLLFTNVTGSSTRASVQVFLSTKIAGDASADIAHNQTVQTTVSTRP